jgi:hypothetical protein
LCDWEVLRFHNINGYEDRPLIGTLLDDEGQRWDIQLPPKSTMFLRSRGPVKRAYLRVSAKP